MDKETFNARQRERRLLSGNANTKKYEKTKNGFLMRVYRNMTSRIMGIQWRKEHLYKGKTLLEKDDFYAWSKNNSDFHALFDAWESVNYDRRSCPSIDRIDSDLGYTLDNMRWIPFHENCRNVKRRSSKSTT